MTTARKRTVQRLMGLLVLLAFAHPSASALAGLGCALHWVLTVGWQKAFEPIGHH